ncbi:MAG TPA: HPF/RaiA family ribosome-associated protein [Steroidobacteraceae bacterium]|nr:HPF/RaiA family ribosome-associated protein [Steroidobacteraceae bacterium]
MQIQVNTDRNVHGDEALSAEVNRTVEGALSRFSDDITRVEVHLSDENSNQKARGNGDMRCLMEARLEGLQPIAVTHRAATSSQAVEGAADKLTRLIESTLGRLRAKHSQSGNPISPVRELPDER